MNIRNKIAAITGASSGIGKAIALELATHGVKMVLGARRAAELESVVTDIRQHGGEALAVTMDVKNKNDVRRLVDTAMAQYGKLDVMINNAGISQLSRIDELDVDGWEEMIDVNLKGVLYGMASAIPEFRKQGSGHIINIISTAGIKIVPAQGVYAATKNAVRTLTEAFRQESDGTIRITGISPGFVHTNFAEGIKNQDMKTAIKKNMAAFAIAPGDIARAVVYALSQPPQVEIGDIVIRPSAQN
ncbi:SDR family oxidoreductase [Chitinophaga qingshengii]|uniref:SDR family oxidoreductase n=1 Tax=Chitinophaga qingshengii TaxID=1569794 RepID=A0ABR7TTR7_9BACT|nr:SDR family oxidoreductase [Chitinophaga qingshengii]MBC9933012.1 SDR family oxidoreductase [Chitinophaga qingshengii]